MSELRCYHVKACATKDCTFENGSADNQAYIGMLAYAKDEADKVIAELEERHKKEVGQLLMEIAELKAQYKDMDVTHTVHIAKMNAKIEEQESVIAELEEKHKTEVKELLCLIRDKENNFNRALDSEEKELRHHKYKRCLAMAWWCSAELGMLVSTFEFKINHYKKWQKRWLKIAEQFKEAK